MPSLSTVPNIVKHRQTRRACLRVTMSSVAILGRDGCGGGENELSRKRSIIQY